MSLEANAYLTSDAVSDNIIPELYNEELQQFQYELEALRPLGSDVTERILPRAGNNLNIYKGTEFAVGQLTQGTDTPVSELDFDSVVLTVNEYGDAKQIPLDTIEDSFEFLVGDLAYGAASAIAENNDNVIMTELNNTSENAIYPISSGVTRVNNTNIAVTNVFDKEQVTEARRRMRINNRYLKYLVIHPNQYKAILDDEDFIPKDNYPAGILMNASVGKLFGAEVIEHNSVTSVTENSVSVYRAMALGEDRAGRQKSFVFGYKRMPVMEFDREFNRKRAVTFHYHYRIGAKIVWDEGIIPIKSA